MLVTKETLLFLNQDDRRRPAALPCFLAEPIPWVSVSKCSEMGHPLQLPRLQTPSAFGLCLDPGRASS